MFQASTLRASLLSINRRNDIAQTALTKRFMIIAIMLPFSHLMLYTHPLVYTIPPIEQTLTEDVSRYWACLVSSPIGEGSCSTTALVQSFAMDMIIKPLVFAVFGVILVVYSLIPVPARQLWKSHFKRILQCLKRE